MMRAKLAGISVLFGGLFIAFVVEAAPRRLVVARTYLALGVEHILTGVDHLLFVSGLLLLVTGIRRLLFIVSVFTLSHTVTLSLATLGFVHVPPALAEAVIALSILFVAYEVLRKNENPSDVAQRKPWLVAFSFGLLHGLGFAGGLSAAGLPAGRIPLALGFFSAGVEVGHSNGTTGTAGDARDRKNTSYDSCPYACHAAFRTR